MKATLLEIASRRTQPQELPGLEAMMPESPCIALLNNTRLRSIADLAVISGDLAPEGIWQQLKTLAVDALFCEDNDLVVNTAAWKDGPEKRCCLASARDFYAQAFERAEAAGSVDNYAGLKAATIAFLLGPNGDRARWTAIVQQCADEAVRRTASGNTFWDRAGVPDALLLGALWEETLLTQSDAIQRAYLDLLEGGGIPRAFDSVLAQMETLLVELASDPMGTASRDALTKLRDNLLQAGWPRA